MRIRYPQNLITGKPESIIKVVGLVLLRQYPETIGSVCFIIIEDETGVAKLMVFREVFENMYRKEILYAKLLMIQGKLQQEGQAIHVTASHCEDWFKLPRSLTATITVRIYQSA